MTQSALPDLPPAFTDCARNLDVGALAAGFVPLETILQSGLMADGFVGLLGKWGPGDYRAAVSLWTQGYFGRLFRPVLAYGLIHDIWFSQRLTDVSVALSDLSTPARFAVKQASPASVEQHLWSIVHEQARPVIDSIVSLSATSERLHWSNASFAFHRSIRQIRSLWTEAQMPAAVSARLRQVERVMASNHPIFQLTGSIPDADGGYDLARKVCCIRFKLDGLKQCGAVCPMERPACCSRRKDANIHIQS